MSHLEFTFYLFFVFFPRNCAKLFVSQSEADGNGCWHTKVLHGRRQSAGISWGGKNMVCQGTYFFWIYHKEGLGDFCLILSMSFSCDVGVCSVF